MNLKLLILDIDGVLTDGTKIYDINHKPIYKRFMCKDFTAIKRFSAAGVKVIMISGDNWNKTMAEKRNIDFYCTRDKEDGLDKSLWLNDFKKKYKVEYDDMMFVGDDYFDYQMFDKLLHTACPSDSPLSIKNSAFIKLNSKGGEGCIVELYDICQTLNYINGASIDKVIELDKLEQSTAEMR
tara:strand:- start:1399 stop:1944 length:546 start_codon:yes stop_codon:yes gene_type:complete